MISIENKVNRGDVDIDNWTFGNTEDFCYLMSHIMPKPNTGRLPFGQEIDSPKLWIKALVDLARDGSRSFYISYKKRCVGIVLLMRSSDDYCAEMNLFVDVLPEVQGRGIATEVVRLVMEYLTCLRRPVKRITATVYGENPAAVRVFEKNGFEFEGVLSNMACDSDGVYDAHIYGYVYPESDIIPCMVLDPYFHVDASVVRLRPWTLKDDVDYYRLFINISYAYETEIMRCSNVEEAMGQIQQFQYNEEKGLGIYRAVVVEDKIVGTVRMDRGNDFDSCFATVGCALDNLYVNKGIGTKAMRQLVELAFTTTDVDNLMATIYAPNKASVRMVEKLDFTLYVTKRCAVWKNQQFCDALYYGLRRDQTNYVYLANNQ